MCWHTVGWDVKARLRRVERRREATNTRAEASPSWSQVAQSLHLSKFENVFFKNATCICPGYPGCIQSICTKNQGFSLFLLAVSCGTIIARILAGANLRKIGFVQKTKYFWLPPFNSPCLSCRYCIGILSLQD